MKGILPKRGTDKWGSGAYKAPRGDRTHDGIDLAVAPGTAVESLWNGQVTKLGYPYGDDLSFRYVALSRDSRTSVRVFYVDPRVSEGQTVHKGDILGVAQDLTSRYPGIKNHIHVEVIQDGEAIDPEDFV